MTKNDIIYKIEKTIQRVKELEKILENIADDVTEIEENEGEKWKNGKN